MRFKSFLLLFNFFVGFTVFAQTHSVKSEAILAEKIYLQLDSNVYTTNSNIWFKAIVTNAVTHNRGTLSGVLYVELIGLNEKIIDKKTVKLTNGIGHNFFALPKNFQHGKYMVRAYTQWSKNFGSDFMFKTYIDVFPSFKKDEGGILENVILKENDKGGFTLNAKLKPEILDSLQRKHLTVFLTLGSKKDTLRIKQKGSLGYILNYDIDSLVNDVTFELETENMIRHRETVLLDDKYMDVQFFPEGGEMVDGIHSKVGFKVLNHKGKGVRVVGDILDKQGTVVAAFRCNKLGMGAFYLKGNFTANYYAKIVSPSKLASAKKFPLPKAVLHGTVLTVKKSKEKIRIKVASNQKRLKKISLQVTCRGVTYYSIKGELKDGKLETDALLRDNLPEGILAITVLDNTNRPVVERLYFNERPESRLNIQLKTDKDSYASRDKTIVSVATVNSKGETKKADVSLLVLNKKQLGEIQDKRTNILTYFLLDSELRGKIESPSYYFNVDNKNRFNDIDALMLTQGWRKYKYNKPLPNDLKYKNEPKLSASGRVGVPFSEIGEDGLELIMMTFGKKPSVFQQRTNSKGWFYFLMNDKFGEPLRVLVQSKNKDGKLRNLPILLDRKTEPKITFGGIPEIKKLDSIVYAYVNTKQNNSLIKNEFNKKNGVIYLDEVTVETRKLSPVQNKTNEKYGEPDVVIEGQAIQEKEKNWSYGLYSVLMFSFPDDIYVYENGIGGFLIAEIYEGGLTRRFGNRGSNLTFDGNATSSGSAIGAGIRSDGAGPISSLPRTLVLVDGKLVMWDDYDMLPEISVSDVKSVEVIKRAKNFIPAYMEVFPWIDPRDIPLSGSFLSIHTYDGKGLFIRKKSKGQFITNIPVFSPSKEFYAPKYDGLMPTDPNIPDLRSLVHWNPLMKENNAGTKFTTFYNADIPGEMLVVVEAISEDGEIGYKELTYEVKVGSEK